MATIIEYPIATPTSKDHLLGTKLADPNLANDTNKTRNFTVQSLASFTNSYSLGYTVYTAQLTAGPGAAPTATVLQNTTGLTFVWSRNVTVTGTPFVANKFWAIVSAKGSEFPSIVRTADNIARVDNILCNTAAAVNGITEGFVEIRIYA